MVAKHALVVMAVAGFAAVPGTGQAADYPCSSVEWIVGWGAGGGSDVFARSIAPGVSDELGVPVSVINMPGASSVVAMQEVLNRDADGCTIFSVTPDQLTNELTGLTELSYRDLEPVMRAHVDIGMLHVRDESPFESWDDVVAWAQENPDQLLVGGVGAASFDEIVVEIVMGAADIGFRYIPYEDASEMHADLIGGRLQVIFEEASVIGPMIADGRVRPLLTLADERLDDYSEVPAAAEFDYEVPPALWRGAAVKAGTDPDTVAQLEAAFLAAADTEKYRDFESERMLDLYPGRLDSSDFAALLEQEYEMYRRVIEAAE